MEAHVTPRLERMIEAALAGARAIAEARESGIEVEAKADASPVTEADRAAEAAILEHLARDFPDVPVVAEEAASRGDAPQGGEGHGRRFFLVDPLDGTREFVAGRGEWTVNIGLIEDGDPVAGVVVVPSEGMLYAADGDAFRQRLGGEGEREPLAVSLLNGRPVALCSRSHLDPGTRGLIQNLGCGTTRSVGSSAKFCHVAAGEAHVYPRLAPTMQWDTAAGDAVLRAAGGSTLAVTGEKLRYGAAFSAGRAYENPSFVAACDDGLARRAIECAA